MCKQYGVIRISDFGMIHPFNIFVIDGMHAWAFGRHRCFRAIDFARSIDGWMDASFGLDFAFPIQPRWMFPHFSGRRVDAPTDGVDKAAAILSCFLNAGSFNGSG